MNHDVEEVLSGISRELAKSAEHVEFTVAKNPQRQRNGHPKRTLCGQESKKGYRPKPVTP